MIADVCTVRRAGFLIPEREAQGLQPMRGALALRAHWISQSTSRPALILSEVNNVTERGLIALLFEPQLTAMGSWWMRFKGWEILNHPGQGRQVVIQEWRCEIHP